MPTVYHRLQKLARIPVILAILGAYLNSAELLAEFQPDGRQWVGWVGALSVSVALFLCVEAFLHRPTWVTGVAVVGFGLTESLGQILHAALTRGDVVFMTPMLEWVMGYVSPSLVVVVGVVMAFVSHYGFMPAGGAQRETSPEVALLHSDIESLTDAIRQSSVAGPLARRAPRAKAPAAAVQLPLNVNGKNGNAS